MGDSFGNNLKSLMASRGVSASKVAKAIGVSPKTIHEWLGNDGRVPRDLNVIRKLAEYFGCSTHFLLFAEEDPRSFLGEILSKTEIHSGLYEISIKRVTTKKLKE
jgi:transcriptional regulator with XRE-family HTH domain